MVPKGGEEYEVRGGNEAEGKEKGKRNVQALICL